jgi:hypothetical protein
MSAMTDQEFVDWLQSEVRGRRMTSQQRDDLLEQKRLFDTHRTEIERQFQQQVVGYVSGNREVSPTAQGLLALVPSSYPGRMVYFEPIGFGC